MIEHPMADYIDLLQKREDWLMTRILENAEIFEFTNTVQGAQ
jgi:hypothetical protein